MYVFFFSLHVVVYEAFFPVWFFQGVDEVPRMTALNVASKLFGAVLLLSWVQVEKDAWLVPTANMAAALAMAATATVLVHRRLGGIALPSFSGITGHLRGGWPFFVTSLSGMLYVNANRVLIGAVGMAEVAYYDLVDADGKPIGTMPTILLVPTALSAIGTQLYKSLEMRDNTASARMPINNPHAGKFRVEVSRYLGNSNYTGNSTKAWYLLSDPNDLPVIEVAFLNGQEAPTIETATADFNILGVQMRGYHDFGVALQDPRAAIKSKGEV